MKRTLYILLFWLLAFQYGYSQISGKAVAITDGETFTLLTEEEKTIKIRLCGIDTKTRLWPIMAKQFFSDEILKKLFLSRRMD